MGGKKKKKSKKKKEKAEGDEEEKQEENPLFTVNLPEYGWIRVELRLCDPPTSMYNSFRVVMRSDERILELKQRIIDYHGRVENITIFNKDPYPPRTQKNGFRMQKKPRVPPFRLLPKLLELDEEKKALDEKQAQKEKRREETGNRSDSEEDKEKYYLEKEDPHKFDMLGKFDFPLDEMTGKHIVNFDQNDITLYEIFQEYGTAARPKENPKFDPKPPPPKEKKPVKPPTPKPKAEGEDGEPLSGEEGDGKVEEEPEEEVFIPPVDKFLYYDFDTHNGKDPILLALMIKGENDQFTL